MMIASKEFTAIIISINKNAHDVGPKISYVMRAVKKMASYAATAPAALPKPDAKQQLITKIDSVLILENIYNKKALKLKAFFLAFITKNCYTLLEDKYNSNIKSKKKQKGKTASKHAIWEQESFAED